MGWNGDNHKCKPSGVILVLFVTSSSPNFRSETITAWLLTNLGGFLFNFSFYGRGFAFLIKEAVTLRISLLCRRMGKGVCFHYNGRAILDRNKFRIVCG